MGSENANFGGGESGACSNPRKCHNSHYLHFESEFVRLYKRNTMQLLGRPFSRARSLSTTPGTSGQHTDDTRREVHFSQDFYSPTRFVVSTSAGSQVVKNFHLGLL